MDEKGTSFLLFVTFKSSLTGEETTNARNQFDVFEKDIIIFPINIHNTHWTCAAVNVKQKRFEYYDSLGSRMQKAHSVSPSIFSPFPLLLVSLAKSPN